MIEFQTNDITVKISGKVANGFTTKDRFSGTFWVDHVTETLKINLDTGKQVYTVRFTGPSLTSTGKQHSVNRGESQFTLGSFGDDLHEMPADLRSLTKGHDHLARMAGR